MASAQAIAAPVTQPACPALVGDAPTVVAARRPRGGLWRELLTAPGVKRLVAATFAGRVSASMLPLGLMLVANAQTGSIAYAGVLTGAFAAASAGAGFLQVRLQTWFGPRAVFGCLSVISTASVAVVLAAMMAGAPRALIIALGVVAGLARPYTASAMRGVWRGILDDPRKKLAAEAFEATTFPLAFSVGPIALAVITSLSDPQTALIAAAAIGGLATATFAGSPLLGQGTRASGRPRRGNWFEVDWRLGCLVLIALTMFCGSEAAPVVVAALGGGHMSGAEFEVLLSFLPVGGVVGGAAFAAIRSSKSVEAQLVAALTVLAFGLTALSQFHGPLTIAIAVFVVGIARAPAIACLFHLAGDSGSRRSVDAIAWIAMTSYLGGALCRPLAGFLAEGPGPHAAGVAVTVPLVAALLAVGVVVVSRRPARQISIALATDP